MASSILSDFAYFWTAGRVALDNSNPYDLQTFSNYAPHKEAVFVQFNYPPWAYWVFYPFASVPYEIAQFLWLGLALIAYLVSGATLCAFLREKGHSKPDEVVWLALTGSPAVIQDLISGQSNWLCLMGWSLFLLCYQRKHLMAGGAFLSLASLKPHLFGFVFLFILLNSLLKGRFLVPGGFAIGIIVQLLLSLSASPGLLSYFLESLRVIVGSSKNYHWGVTIPQIFGSSIDYNFLAVGCTIVGIILTLSIMRSRYSSTSKLLLCSSISIPLAPHAFLHAAVLLIPVWAVACVSFRPLHDRLVLRRSFVLLPMLVTYLLTYVLVKSGLCTFRDMYFSIWQLHPSAMALVTFLIIHSTDEELVQEKPN